MLMDLVSRSRVGALSSSAPGRCAMIPGRVQPCRAYRLAPGDHAAFVQPAEVPKITRRVLFITVPVAATVWHAWSKAQAAEDGYRKFMGYNMQPDLYLGRDYGTSMNQTPQYSFEYPSEWQEDEITKTEKSTMGMDGRVMDPKHPKERAFVIALGGKDYKDARLVNLKQTMDAFAGGDADLRAAITDATDIKQVVKKMAGKEVYMYDITSDRRRYLSTIAQGQDGTMYALFVTASPSAFARKEQQLRHIQDTFVLL